MTAPRGLRNNNPGNIIYNPRNDWHGQVGCEPDGRFSVFSEPAYGIRAIVKILQSYQRRGISELRQIIATWAPSVENDVDAYVESVCHRTGFESNWIMKPDDYPRLIEAICYHENGQPVSMTTIMEGIKLAARK